MLGLPCGVLVGVKKLFFVGVPGRDMATLALSMRLAMKLAIGRILWRDVEDRSRGREMISSCRGKGAIEVEILEKGLEERRRTELEIKKEGRWKTNDQRQEMNAAFCQFLLGALWIRKECSCEPSETRATERWYLVDVSKNVDELQLGRCKAFNGDAELLLAGMSIVTQVAALFGCDKRSSPVE